MLALPDSVESAQRKAISFLLAEQDEHGAWSDFMLPAGSSNLWVSAFVGYALAESGKPDARAAATIAWGSLERAAGSAGGWSYNRNVPGDGDSTLWALRLADELGLAEVASARAGARFLETHLRADGGVTTYAEPDAVRRYVGLPATVPFDGWRQSHVCVSAAAANLAQMQGRVRPYLHAHQHDHGHWAAYWWFDDEYATAEATAALARSGDAEAVVSIERAAQWALGRVADLSEAAAAEPPAFALASALRILSRATRTPQRGVVLDEGIRTLLSWQEARGSWPASARLRVPRPDVIKPRSDATWTRWRGLPPGQVTVRVVLEHTFNNYSLDERKAYTTATVLRALTDVQRLTERSRDGEERR